MKQFIFPLIVILFIITACTNFLTENTIYPKQQNSIEKSPNFSSYSLTEAGTFQSPGNWFTHLCIKGPYAYVTGYDHPTNFTILNIQNPANITKVYEAKFGNNAYTVATKGKYLYLANGDAGIKVLDITHPENPGLIYEYDTAGFFNFVEVQL